MKRFWIDMGRKKPPIVFIVFCQISLNYQPADFIFEIRKFSIKYIAAQKRNEILSEIAVRASGEFFKKRGIKRDFIKIMKNQTKISHRFAGNIQSKRYHKNNSQLFKMADIVIFFFNKVAGKQRYSFR